MTTQGCSIPTRQVFASKCVYVYVRVFVCLCAFVCLCVCLREKEHHVGSMNCSAMLCYTSEISKMVGTTLKVMLLSTKLMLRVPRSMLRERAPVLRFRWNCMSCEHKDTQSIECVCVCVLFVCVCLPTSVGE